MTDFRQLLEVQTGSNHRFHGSCLAGSGGRIFGGQLLGQALAAAGSGVDATSHPPASVHGHFLAPGDAAVPVEYEVARLKEGRRFLVRRVDARQAGRLIATATATFHGPEQAPEHQTRMPPVEDPDDCPAFRPEEFGATSPAHAPVEARLAGFDETVPALRVWLRFTDPLPQDVVLRTSALVWLSDLCLTRTVDLPRRKWAGFRQGASLDHSVWFHRATDPGEWLLADQLSDTYTGARGIATGRFFDVSGVLRATAVQECLIRRPALEPVI